MVIANWNLEFLAHNAERNYPFAAEAGLKDVTNSFTLPDDFVVGLDMAISSGMSVATSRFFMQQISIFSSGIRLVFAYDTGSAVVQVATATVPRFNFVRNSSYPIYGLPGHTEITGTIMIGRLETLNEQPTGLFSFDLSATNLEPSTIRPCVKGISSIAVANSSGVLSRPFFGDIQLVAGTNIQLSTVVSGDTARIVISALSGEGTIEECVCEGGTPDAPPITRINGIAPDASGNFTILGDNCISFESATNGLKAEDSCCQPCCGNDELEVITRDLERMHEQRTTYELIVRELQSEATKFRTSALSSRLADRRCTDCE